MVIRLATCFMLAIGLLMFNTSYALADSLEDALIARAKELDDLHRGGLLVWVFRHGTYANPQPVSGAKAELRFPGKNETLNKSSADSQGNAVFNQPLVGGTGQRTLLVSAPGYEPLTKAVDILFDERNVVLAPLKKIGGSPTQKVQFKISQPLVGELLVAVNQRGESMTAAESADLVKQEDKLYSAVGWKLAPDGFEVRPDGQQGIMKRLPAYSIGKNKPSYDQLCGGLALCQLVGGPLPLDTNTAKRICDKFGKPVTEFQPNDIIYWSSDGGKTPHHFSIALSVSPRMGPYVLSKDQRERVWMGRAANFPSSKGYGKFYGVRLNIADIDVVKVGQKLEARQPQKALSIPGTLSNVDIKVANAVTDAADKIVAALAFPNYELHVDNQFMGVAAHWKIPNALGGQDEYTLGASKDSSASSIRILARLKATPAGARTDLAVDEDGNCTVTNYKFAPMMGAFTASKVWNCGRYQASAGAFVQALPNTDPVVSGNVVYGTNDKMVAIARSTYLEHQLELPLRPTGFPGNSQ